MPMRITLICLLAAAFASMAQTPRRIGDDQPLPDLVSSLPAAQRAAIDAAIEPTLWDWFVDDDDADMVQQDILRVEHDLRYEHTTLGGHELTLVQAHNVDGCGATGNCLFFVLDSHNDPLLSGVSAQQFTILSTEHHGLPDIQLGTHISALQTSQDWYQFDGQKYKRTRCAVDTFGVDHNDSKSHREFSPCKL
jgi:hypothetical protein